MPHCLKLLWRQNQPAVRRKWTILVSLTMHYYIWSETCTEKMFLARSLNTTCILYLQRYISNNMSPFSFMLDYNRLGLASCHLHVTHNFVTTVQKHTQGCLSSRWLAYSRFARCWYGNEGNELWALQMDVHKGDRERCQEQNVLLLISLFISELQEE